MEHDMDQIYKKYSQKVYNYLFCLCRDRNIADDLTQETFACAIMGIKKFRGECKIDTWLCQIGKRLWYKELDRGKKLDTVSIDSMNLEIGEIGPGTSMEEEFMEREVRMELYKRIDELDSSVRELMYLRLTTELSFKEIALVLGKSETWSRVNYYREKRKIIEKIRKEEKENETK